MGYCCLLDIMSKDHAKVHLDSLIPSM